MNRPSAVALLASALLGPAALGQIVPKPIPAGYDFPSSQKEVEGWVATSNTKAIRSHAWDMWAGMGADSGEKHDGNELPIWETWDGTGDLFPPPASPAPRAAPHRAFVKPHQFVHLAQMKKAPAPELPSSLVSFNKFDPSAAGFLRTPHKGPGGKEFRYYSGSSLTALNGDWPSGTKADDRAIEQFPHAGIETKPVMDLVKAKGLTALPLWRGTEGATNETNPTPDTWTTCVLVDPAGKGKLEKATEKQIKEAIPAKGLACKEYLYGPLSLLYHFKLSAAEAADYNAAQGGGAAAGDFAVLVAMHVNSREIPHWTWQTFWWQPGADAPKRFPGSKEGQTKKLKAPWTEYAMCTVYAQTTKPGGTTMEVCFNPYLETSPGIPEGIHSNCMSCHGVATVGAGAGYPSSYAKPIAFFTDPVYFNDKTTHTDFSWAVADAP
jgi:hypothetical protein